MPALSAEARSILGQAHHLFIAMETSGGPHVTPELFVESGGRLWCLLAAPTLKARRLADGRPVGVSVPGRGRHLVGTGRASVVDPARPRRLLRDRQAALGAPVAVGLFALRNGAELTGAALDLLRGRLGGPLPARRVALCIEMDRAMVVDDAPGAVPSQGVRAGRRRRRAPRPPRPAELPDPSLGLLGGGPAAVGWTAADGDPVVLPGCWDDEHSTALVPGEPFDRLRCVDRSPVAVTRDGWSGLGPSGKQGVMLRGPGEVTGRRGDGTVEIAVDAERWTYWDGIETATQATKG